MSFGVVALLFTSGPCAGAVAGGGAGAAAVLIDQVQFMTIVGSVGGDNADPGMFLSLLE